ncbi:alpha/beta hydrolase [Paenibacillus senegalensis]|uniref:alpha/beta hydrolase n=1 Tax=Paenibacillus senegalensis TaxID=1465766 RepID=UPI00028A3677|nr:alpha/beta hydrolase family protein [Paenibacillus senegalensis]
MIRQPMPVTFYSPVLERRLTFYVCLPPGYETSGRQYPSIYLLHGRFGSEIDWPYKGAAYETISRLTASGQLTEAVVIMPSDGGFSQGTYYTDWHDGSGRFEQYFIQDLIPFVESQYRIKSERSSRAIGGLSMGGFGSLYFALRHPDKFAAAGSMSGALGMFPQTGNLHLGPDWSVEMLERVVGPLDGPYALERNLAILAARVIKQADLPALYFDCGTEDFLYESNLWFKDQLTKLNYPFTYQDFPGSHTWEYWSEHLADVLLFLNRHISRHS